MIRPVRRRAEAWLCAADAIDRPSVERTTPPCPHFGICGGCALQHWQPAPLAVWKAARVENALRRAGFCIPVAPAVATPPASRRRMDFAIRRLPSGVILGLHGVDAASVVPVEFCQVQHPRLLAIMAPLQATLDRLAGLRRQGSAVLNLLDTGPDLLLGHDAPLTAPDRQRLTAFAAAHGIPRIAVHQGRPAREWEIACQLGPATISFAGVPVTPPPGAFLQASAEGEAAIVAAVVAGLPERLSGRARICELYAGCGSLTLPLAARARVAAFEGDADAASCLATGARAGGRVMVTTRDLARQPLAVAELNGFAAVVLDPPFAGAAGQMAGIAACSVPRVIYVSCNPAVLARDGAVLAGGGFRPISAVAIDQFIWSPHVESVTVWQR